MSNTATAPSRTIKSASIADLIATIREQKKAESADPGGMDGKTSHPSGQLDGGKTTTTEGSRAKEIDKELKEQSPSTTPNEAPSPPDQSSVQMDIGGHKSYPTGENVPSSKDTKDDTTTASPASTEKLASMSFAELHALSTKQADALLADIAVRLRGKAAAAGTTTAPTQPTTPVQPTAPVSETATDKFAAAGYTAAAAATEKRARAEAAVREMSDLALQVGQMVGEEINAVRKRADGGMPPPDAPMPGPGAPPAPPAAPMDAAAGAPPGAPPGGDPGAGGGMPPEEELDQLMAAILEAGYTPEQVLAAIEKAQGGAAGAPPGGAPPGGPGGDIPAGGPPTPEDQANLKAAAANVRKGIEYQRTGRFKMAAAQTPKQRLLRDQFKAAVLDLVK